jgi:hypothetical protein
MFTTCKQISFNLALNSSQYIQQEIQLPTPFRKKMHII